MAGWRVRADTRNRWPSGTQFVPTGVMSCMHGMSGDAAHHPHTHVAMVGGSGVGVLAGCQTQLHKIMRSAGPCYSYLMCQWCCLVCFLSMLNHYTTLASARSLLWLSEDFAPSSSVQTPIILNTMTAHQVVRLHADSAIHNAPPTLRETHSSRKTQ